MKNFTSRNKELKIKINSHLKKLTGVEKDFYSVLTHDDILHLKTVLSDIHNLLTYKLTLKAGNWITKEFKFSKNDEDKLLEQIDNTKPNQQGFDILINKPHKILAEVKCNVPVKEGSKYGSQQSEQLIKDAKKLLEGNRQIRDTNDYLKFLFVLDIGNKSHEAAVELIRQVKIRKETERGLMNNKIRENLIIVSNDLEIEKLSRERVYIKVIALE